MFNAIALWTESVEWVWAIWLASLVSLLWCCRAAARKSPWQTIADFLADESGASYALAYVMTLPFLVLIMCLVLQGTFILLAKYGTVHAAYAASRAAIVWQGADPTSESSSRDLVDRYADRAAITAMTPFAAGVKMAGVETMLLTAMPGGRGMSRIDREVFLATEGQLYPPMYRRLATVGRQEGPTSTVIRNPDGLADNDYVKQKLRVAALCTDAVVRGNDDITPMNEDVTVAVSYRMPLQIPLAAPLFDTDGGGGWFGTDRYYARTITTTVTLPSEAARNRWHHLEVPYFPDEI